MESVADRGAWPELPLAAWQDTLASYAYPQPAGFAEAPVQPGEAFYSKELGEFLLPYDVVRQASDPDSTLLAFLESTFEAAARLAHWP
jgi:hypothetical protein